MEEPMAQATIASIPQNLTVQQAATAISRLINSNPRTPWLGEIEAIVARVGSPDAAAMSPPHAALYQEWRDLIDKHIRDFENPDEAGMTPAEIEADEARMSASIDTIDALKASIFAVPARTWSDVMLYAQAACWEYWAGIDPEGREMRSGLDDGPQSDHADSVALAKLLEAIFTVAGVGHFATGGRRS
jgi:hypothetical protein